MKIAIIGAGGRAGKLLTEEAMHRGHEALAIVRRHDAQVRPGAVVMVRDLFSLTYEDIKDCPVIIDAFGVWEPKKLTLHQGSLKHLADLLSGKPNRLLVVGSAGTLHVDPVQKRRLVDSENMPEIYKPLARAMAAAFDQLRARLDVNWTYMSPPGFFDPDSLRTGRYKTGRDDLLFNTRGESAIGYADAAIALIDEAEAGAFIKARFTVCAV
jgi:putative NADH-flavin reductase